MLPALIQCKASKCQKHWSDCASTSIRVIKAIRLRYSTLESWIQDSDIKVRLKINQCIGFRGVETTIVMI